MDSFLFCPRVSCFGPFSRLADLVGLVFVFLLFGQSVIFVLRGVSPPELVSFIFFFRLGPFPLISIADPNRTGSLVFLLFRSLSSFTAILFF